MQIQEREISENVKARWGFPDGHVEIIVRIKIPIPFLPDQSVTLRIEPPEIPIVENIAKEATAWLKKIQGSRR